MQLVDDEMTVQLLHVKENGDQLVNKFRKGKFSQKTKTPSTPNNTISKFATISEKIHVEVTFFIFINSYHNVKNKYC